MDLTTLQTAFDSAYKVYSDTRSSVEALEAPSDAELKSLDDAADAYEAAEKALDAGRLRAAKSDDIERRRSERSDRRSKPITMPHHDPANARHALSPVKMLRAAFNGEPLDGIEAETHQESIRQRSAAGLSTRGVTVPLDAEFQVRATVTTTTGAGGIAEVIRMPMIDALMAHMVLPALGVTVLPSDGPFKLPRSSAATSYFVGEDQSPDDGSPGLDAVSFGLHTAAARGKVTRKMMLSSSIDAEAWLLNYLLKAVAARIQVGALTGTDANGQPDGFFNLDGTDNINVIPLGTNGAALDRNKLLSMVAPVVASNAAGRASFLTNAKVTSKLEATPAETGHPVYLCDPFGQTIVGRPYQTTDHVPGNVTTGSTANTSHIAYGVWGESALALFSGLDVVFGDIDDAGSRNIKVFQDMDFHLLQPKAFSVAKGVVTA